ARENLALLAARPKISAAAIYNARGKPFAVYRRTDALNRELPKLPEADGWRINGAELELFRRIVDNNEILGTVYLRADSELGARLKDYLGILAAVLGVSLLLASLMSVWLQGVLTRPILAVTEVAREVIDRRDFSLRVRKSTDDEIGVLVDAFNGMLAEVGRRAEALEEANRALEREMAARQRKDDELRELNADLERRVAARTKELEAANKELEGFSYSVSHDLRAPLRGIMGFAAAVVEDHGAELSDEARRRIGIVQSEARRMGQLIDDLLAFSRLGRQALQTTSLDMTKLAQTAFDDLRAQHDGQEVDLHLGTLPGARGDRVLLGQVWMNLLSNALKYSSKRETPRVDVSATTDEKEHVYFVRDNGAGFDPRYQSKLFGVFQRLHDSSEFPGTGVGLALVQRIVARHGGRVWAEGKPNGGATFYFTLPKEQSG
ncbi:MAG TPA: ATP-binding protein, partial [Burkholderiales bacterium]|nr:ATP-binding protein [Burkholderiales bacterium]